jgi:ferredoxin-type protein NapG
VSDDTPARKPKKPVLGEKKRLEERRKFLRSVALAGGGVTAALLGFVPVLAAWEPRLRPPGALVEAKFLASCIKCGQCVQVCPVEAIRLADLLDGFGLGTPYIMARDQACDFSCDGLQCVLACPTGALTHEIAYPHQVRIGFAEVARPDKCLAMQGKGFRGRIRDEAFEGKFRYGEIDRWNPLRVRSQDFDLPLCDLCVRHCPIEIRMAQCAAGKPPAGDRNQCPPKRAIGLEPMAAGPGPTARQPVVFEGCVGCGACEMVCPTEPPAIVVDMTKNADTVRPA